MASRYRTAGSPCSITHKVIDVKVPLPIACRISVGAENREEKKRHLCSFTKAAIFVLISFCLWGVSDPSSKVYLNLINIYMHRNSCKEKTHHVYWRINATLLWKTKPISKVKNAACKSIWNAKMFQLKFEVFFVYMSAFQNSFYGTKLKLRIHLHAFFCHKYMYITQVPFFGIHFFLLYGLLIGIL